MRLFGFEIKKQEKDKQQEKKEVTFANPVADGSIIIPNGHSSHYLSLNNHLMSEFDLINQYRQMSTHEILSEAIEEIVNDAIVNDENKSSVQINLDNVEKIPSSIKKKIEEEFKETLRLLEFNRKGYEQFRDWYVDSRIVFHKIVDKDNIKSGIKNLLRLDPRRIIKIKEIQSSRIVDNNVSVISPQITDEYFMYFESPIELDPSNSFGYRSNISISSSEAVSYLSRATKITPESITYVDSGLVDRSSNIIYGFLQKAVKPFNELNGMEAAMVIYRLSRSSEKRVFYIDVNGIPPAKQDDYMRRIQAALKNSITYDAVSGKVTDDRKFMALQEDFWIPRRDSKTAEISTLPGGQNLGDIQDVEYFQRKLERSTNVPRSRLTGDNSTILLGNNQEISREELKFSKFITRLRTKFSEIFDDILSTNLILKGILKLEDWEQIKENIHYDWLADSYYSEARDAALLNKRIETVNMIDGYVGPGKYYSRNFVRKNILKQTDDEIERINDENKNDIDLQINNEDENENKND